MNEQPITITWNGATLPDEVLGIERCVRRQNAFGVAYCEIILYGNQDSLRSLQLNGQEITVTFEKKLHFQGNVVASTTMLSQLSGHPIRQIIAVDKLAIVSQKKPLKVFYGESIKKVLQTTLNPLPLSVECLASIPQIRLSQVVQLGETHEELLAWLLDITSTWIMLDKGQNVVWRAWLPPQSQAYAIDDTQNNGMIVSHEEVATPTKDAHILITAYDHQQGQAQSAQLATDTQAASQLKLSTVGNVDINSLAEFRRSRQRAWEMGISGILPIIEDKLSCGQVVETDDGPRYVIDSLHAWQLGDRGYTLFSTVPGGINWLLRQYRHLDWLKNWLTDTIQEQDKWPWHSRQLLTQRNQCSAHSVLLGTVKAYHPKVEKMGLTDAVEITLQVGDQSVELFARQTHSFLFPNGSGGLQAPPQPGTEVAIRFLDQQPLVPVVIGYLGNSRHPPPPVDTNLQPIVLKTGNNQLMLSKESDGRLNLMAAGEMTLQSGKTLEIQGQTISLAQTTSPPTASSPNGGANVASTTTNDSHQPEKTLEIQGQTISLAQTTSPLTASSPNGGANVASTTTNDSHQPEKKSQSQSQSQSQKQKPSGNLIEALWEYSGGAALCGETVKLIAKTKDAEGDTVDFKIYRCGIGADSEVETLSATVTDNRAELEWIFEDDEDKSELPKYPPKKGESFATQHYFKAIMDNNSLESPRLTWQTSLYLSIEDDQKRHYPLMRYRLIDAAGVQHEGVADSEGYINIEALAAGPWWVEPKPANTG